LENVNLEDNGDGKITFRWNAGKYVRMGGG